MVALVFVEEVSPASTPSDGTLAGESAEARLRERQGTKRDAEGESKGDLEEPPKRGAERSGNREVDGGT